MGVAREMEIIWDELIDAFLNPDPDMVFFLDRETGEVFFVPDDYEDESFWHQIDVDDGRYLQIPGVDYEQERMLFHDFIRGLSDGNLKQLLQRTLTGRSSFGKMEDILSFYPDELEAFLALRDDMINTRIRTWLEEHDIYPPVAGG